MKSLPLILILALSGSINATEVEKSAGQPMRDLSNYQWNHGALDCEKNDDPSIEVYRYSATTFLLRQNKCTHYEAPFIYVLFGTKTVFVQDTGATSDPKQFPLYATIKNLVQQKAKRDNRKVDDYQWLVTHSHSHSDHIAGDDQFRNKPNVTLIEPNLEAVQKAFKLNKAQWPYEHAYLELGNRRLTIIPLPGHKSDAVAVYDGETQWLLTGDSLYPGRLYVKEWKTFRSSIKRLTKFAQSNPIAALMGTHIEMNKTPGQDYEMGSTYQPAEAELPMSPRDLRLLNDIMQGRLEPSRVVTERFIVYPLD